MGIKAVKNFYYLRVEICIYTEDTVKAALSRCKRYTSSTVTKIKNISCSREERLIVLVCVVICHTLFQLVPVVVAELRTVEWAVEQTLILTKLTTAGWSCSAEEFSLYYSMEQKIWLEVLFKKRVQEVN